MIHLLEIQEGAMSDKRNLRKTLQLTVVVSLASSVGAFLIQSRANTLTSACSYLDPVTIDIVAVLFGLFLVIDGLNDIYRCRLSAIQEQWPKSIRVAIGISILLIHIMQFLHKNI
ncbi:MAG TPA: hypothetical protein PK470_05275 [Candidatus Omnitrophota bacterium]|nr:hypothetical protein [Candidatus Omnitrophota bacterium]